MMGWEDIANSKLILNDKFKIIWKREFSFLLKIDHWRLPNIIGGCLTSLEVA